MEALRSNAFERESKKQNSMEEKVKLLDSFSKSLSQLCGKF